MIIEKKYKLLEDKIIIKDESLSYLSINQIQKNKRNIGIDLARILAMYFIINHHIIYHGGPIFGTKLLSFDNNLFLFFNTLFCSGVNIFGMISGFVGFHSYKYSNLLYLLIQTSLYNYSIAYFFFKINPEFVRNLKYFLYPLFITDYWYFNAYFIMYFFFPVINAGVKAMDKRKLGIFNLFIFLFFSCFNQIKHYSITLKKDLFLLNNGFTYIWLIILYFFGSYFGKYNSTNNNYNKYLMFVILSVIIFFVTFCRNLIIINKLKYYHNADGMRVEYNSPSSVIIALCFIYMFSNIDIKSNILHKIISFFAPLTFGIYLIHNHLIVRTKVFSKNYFWLLKYQNYKLLLFEGFESLKIFIFASLIDYIRFLVFKILRIREICIFISNYIDTISNKILFIFEFIY